MKAPYRSIMIEEDDSEVLATRLDMGRALATVMAHGADPEEFVAKMGLGWRDAPTLGQLRDFLGY